MIAAISALPILLAGCQGATGRSSNECTPDGVHQVVERFVAAFNRGDIGQLDQLVSDQRFVWYATVAPGQRLNAEADDRSTLMTYFAARHREHERLVLDFVNVTFTAGGRGGFWFRLTRSADDGLPPTPYSGKGEIQCATAPSSLTVWAMGAQPWSPVERLLQAAPALILLTVGVGGLVLWRRRRGPRLATGPKAGSLKR